MYYNNRMNQYIKNSIDARRNALSAAYEIPASMQKKVDSLFKDIEELGKKCKDVGEFETEFAKSPLNQQYLDLFTEIAKSSVAKTVAKGAAIGVAESMADQAIRTVLPTRAAVHQKASNEMRSIPVVGDAIDIGQKAGYAAHLGKLFKKKN